MTGWLMCRLRRIASTTLLVLAAIFVTPPSESQAQDLKPHPSVPTFEAIPQSGHSGDGSLMEFSASGEYLAVADAFGKEVSVWHIPSRTLIRKFVSGRGP